MARDTAAVAEAAGVFDALPGGARPFGGRAAELAALTVAAGRPSVGRGRLLVLAGRPGSGRTALAVRWARSVAGDYPDGLLYARMSAPDGTRVGSGRAARMLLDQLGEQPGLALLPGAAEEDPACEALRDALGSRRALVLLDDVRDTGQVWPLLAEKTGSVLLATTSGPLTGIDGIDPVILGGLEHRVSVDLLSELVGGTRISCDPVGAAELAEACANRPAALRLAAGWLRSEPRLPVTEAAERLRRPPEQSRERSREEAAEQADTVPVVEGDPLRGAFEPAYRRLPAARARLLRLCTLAPGQQVDLRTASALVGCPAPEAGAGLAALAELELLEREPSAADGTERYRVPGRLYGRLLELRTEVDRPSELELARARLLERLVRLVDSARLLLDPAAGPNPDPLPGPLRLRSAAHAGQWLLGEREQLLAAVADAVGQGDLDGTAGRLVAALLRALPLTGEAAPADLHALHESVLKVAERQGSPRRAAAALLNLGDLQADADRWEQAAERYRRAVELSRGAGDEAGCARALEAVGHCHRALGDPLRAADAYGRALALRQAVGDQVTEARLLVRLAEAHIALRRFEEALREYRSAAAVLRRLGEAEGERQVAALAARLREHLGQEGLRPLSE
ncbi:tetratricopeptide repeat protein [Kitasatospora sp. CB01950]|uniref:tetratricopeptide repeat protein n=1 Tax=Kitasatospora sp. CB01950 TaxID=1703930 RepID=UPI000A5F2898|nr:tetratricopeptide repeat protein [Kitasatospora sp. CB01950]